MCVIFLLQCISKIKPRILILPKYTLREYLGNVEEGVGSIGERFEKQ